MATGDRFRILERRAMFVQAALSAALTGCVEPAPATPGPGSTPPGVTGSPEAPPGVVAPGPGATAAPSPSVAAAAVDASAPAPAPSAAPTAVVRACLSVIRPRLGFAARRSDLDPTTFTMLDEIAAVLVQRPEVRVSLDGHRDTSELEPTLDERRAESTRSYLVAHGVPAERICTQGFDAERPIAPNATPEGRAANRRVDFRVLEPDEKCGPAKP